MLAQNFRDGRQWWNIEVPGSTQLIIKMFELGLIDERKQPTSLLSVSSVIRDC